MSRPVRIAMLDSGAHVGHPHLPSIAGGVSILADGEAPGYIDTLGHGTAIAALIHHLAPAAELFAVKIFDRRLGTSLPLVLHAIEWCVHNNIDIINLSLGTTNEEHRAHFVEVIERVKTIGAVLVSAYNASGTNMLPGSMKGVVGVEEDRSCEHEDFRAVSGPPLRLATCPFPREIEGVPRERNLHGVSFAVAHMSAQIARRWSEELIGVDWLQRLAEEGQSSLSAHVLSG